jgi:hypothetical protein
MRLMRARRGQVPNQVLERTWKRSSAAASLPSRFRPYHNMRANEHSDPNTSALDSATSSDAEDLCRVRIEDDVLSEHDILSHGCSL